MKLNDIILTELDDQPLGFFDVVTELDLKGSLSCCCSFPCCHIHMHCISICNPMELNRMWDCTLEPVQNQWSMSEHLM